MIKFDCLLEIWQDNQLKYIVIDFHGGSMSLPKQDDIDDRDDIVEKAKEAFPPEHEILDLVGIVYEGDVIWQDILRS